MEFDGNFIWNTASGLFICFLFQVSSLFSSDLKMSEYLSIKFSVLRTIFSLNKPNVLQLYNET